MIDEWVQAVSSYNNNQSSFSVPWTFQLKFVVATHQNLYSPTAEAPGVPHVVEVLGTPGSWIHYNQTYEEEKKRPLRVTDEAVRVAEITSCSQL